jgi:hypothetical protein
MRNAHVFTKLNQGSKARNKEREEGQEEGEWFVHLQPTNH